MKGEGLHKDSEGVWDGYAHIAMFKVDNKKDLQFSTCSSIQR